MPGDVVRVGAIYRHVRRPCAVVWLVIAACTSTHDRGGPPGFGDTSIVARRALPWKAPGPPRAKARPPLSHQPGQRPPRRPKARRSSASVSEARPSRRQRRRRSRSTPSRHPRASPPPTPPLRPAPCPDATRRLTPHPAGPLAEKSCPVTTRGRFDRGPLTPAAAIGIVPGRGRSRPAPTDACVTLPHLMPQCVSPGDQQRFTVRCRRVSSALSAVVSRQVFSASSQWADARRSRRSRGLRQPSLSSAAIRPAFRSRPSIAESRRFRLTTPGCNGRHLAPAIRARCQAPASTSRSNAVAAAANTRRTSVRALGRRRSVDSRVRQIHRPVGRR